jgi:hypothetical protein
MIAAQPLSFAGPEQFGPNAARSPARPPPPAGPSCRAQPEPELLIVGHDGMTAAARLMLT